MAIGGLDWVQKSGLISRARFWISFFPNGRCCQAASVNKREFPKWRFCIQVMPETEAETYRLNPFDLTKVWPHKDYPLIEAGIMELNRNPENYFAEVEQAAFAPSNIVPGIGHSPDKMLQARIFSYADAHRYRLGVNHDSLPANRPRCPVHTYHRDGFMRSDGNGGAARFAGGFLLGHSVQPSLSKVSTYCSSVFSGVGGTQSSSNLART